MDSFDVLRRLLSIRSLVPEQITKKSVKIAIPLKSSRTISSAFLASSARTNSRVIFIVSVFTRIHLKIPRLRIQIVAYAMIKKGFQRMSNIQVPEE